MAKVLRELLPIAATIFGVAYFGAHWAGLPSVVPIHFGLLGQPDGWAPRETALVLPVLAVFMYAMLTAGEFSNSFNLPWQFTDKNREPLLDLCRKLMFALRTQLSIMLAYLQFAFVETAMHRMDGLGVWFAPVFIGSIFLTLALFFAKGQRVAQA